MSGAVQPLLSYGSVPVPAFLSTLVLGSSGFLAPGPDSNIVRLAATSNGLATNAANKSVPLAPGSLGGAYFLNGLYIVSDNSGNIISSADGVTWTAGSLNGAGDLLVPYGMIYDDSHSKLVGCIFGSSTVVTGSGTSPLNLTPSATPNTINTLGYRPGSGVILGLTNDGSGNVYKSTNGGTTWVLAASNIFQSIPGDGWYIAYGHTQWLALGNDSSGNYLATVSTNDGTTWSTPVNTSLTTSVSGSINAGTDNLGNWVIISTSGDPNGYAVSGDDGLTWTAPNIFPQMGGFAPFGMVWDGSKWNGIFFDPTQSYEFIGTSSNGSTWTVGPTVTN